MNEKLKKKWIKALRSGKYKQAQEALWNTVYEGDDEEGSIGHCCLGVLCDIMGYEPTEAGGYSIPITALVIPDGPLHEAIVASDEEDRFSGDPYVKDGEVRINIDGQLPNSFAAPLGLEKKVKDQGRTKSLQNKLAGMNDGGKSFEQIANYLEKVNF